MKQENKKRTMRRRTTVVGGIVYANNGNPPPWENPAIAEDADNRMAQVHAMRGPQRKTLPCGCEADAEKNEFLRVCPVCGTEWLERPDY
jgi:hypothetical protein